MSDMPLPDLPDYCWPFDMTGCTGWDDLDPYVQDAAKSLAAGSLRGLVAYRVGGCPITVRPCTTACAPGPYAPLNWGGTWYNCDCVGGCVHNGLTLTAPVGEVVEVKIDGTILATDEYRLIDGTTIIRADGQPWPATQDMTQPDTESGTWSVTYLNAYKVDYGGAVAGAILACEFAKALTGGLCRLPANVTNIVRAGITMTIVPGSFPGGVTGLREVDVWVRMWNPERLTTPPAVWSPQSSRRPVTWQ